MTIDIWAFNIFTSGAAPAPEDLSQAMCRDTYDRYLRLCPRFEEWGIDGVFFAEHHFSTLFIAPSPQLVVAAVAAKTERLRLGIMGSVLAMHDGRRFVEECGMLEFLTGGRFEPGIGPGSGDAEAVMSGLTSDEIRPRYYSAAELLRKAAAGTFVTHQDEYYNLDNVPMVPPIPREPARSVWTTVMSGESAGWAAQRGWRICTGWLPRPVAVMVADAYRGAAADAGMPVTPEMLGLRRRVLIAPSDAEAHEIHEAAGDLTQMGVVAQGEAADPQVAAMLSHPDDYIVGSPETVAEQIIEQCREGGYGTFAAWSDYATFSERDLFRSYELLGTKVAPVVRSAALEQASV